MRTVSNGFVGAQDQWKPLETVQEIITLASITGMKPTV
jgi:hypothetical protein